MFFITVFEKMASATSAGDFGSTRTVGYYETFELAEKAVVSNHLDIHEYFYEYCLIEKFTQGTFPISDWENRTLYQFCQSEKTFKKIKEPENMRHVINFAIG